MGGFLFSSFAGGSGSISSFLLLLLSLFGGSFEESGLSSGSRSGGSSLPSSAVWVLGSGEGNVPVTISASQSPRPPGTASTAV